MKKIILTAIAFTFLGIGMIAQNSAKKSLKKNFRGSAHPVSERSSVTPGTKKGQITGRTCGTKLPPKQWDEAFNKMVETHKTDLLNGRTASTTYTIPIIFHIIYSSATESVVGTGHNISQAQVNSQIPILNADYNGTGYNSNLYAALTYSGEPAFYQYAALATNSVSPSSLASNGSIAIGVSGIYFCLASKDASGTTLVEPGIDRVAWQSVSGATDPASSSDVETLMDATIKPATIWDPTKYFNVWVSDGGSSGLLGYATFPPASTTGTGGINPNWGESNGYACTSADGVWVAYNALGNTGAAALPYNKGRTLTHESGHWLGLRHIWGDGSCLTDYCNDTPPAGAANYVNCTTGYPYHSGTCSANSPDGEMIMNFMDYSDDCAMYMFTTDQVNRFYAALSLSPCRSGLTASATSVCSGITVTAPVAGFTYPSTLCTGQAAMFTDASTNTPTSYTWTSNPSTGVVITNTNSASPSITFANAGTFTITQAVSNSAGSNSVSHAVTTSTCAVSTTCDTMRNETDLTNVHIYLAGSTPDSGYLSGTNKYDDKAKAEMYTYANNGKQITAIQAYLYKTGTGNVTFNVWNDASGIPGTVIASKTVGLGTLVNGYNTITLTTPITPTSVFYVGFTIPTTAGDTIAFGNDDASGTGSGAFEMWSDNSWNSYTSAYGTDFGDFVFPIMCGTALGIEHNELGSNITLFPNPSNGQFNFAVALAEPTNLNFTVINMLGQVVYTKSVNNVLNTKLNVDLSNLAKGVYYANIMDSNNNKTVKKIIIE